VFVETGEAGEFGDIEERGEAVDFLGGKIWLWNGIMVLAVAGEPEGGGFLDIAGGLFVGGAVGDASAQGGDSGNVGGVFVAPVDFYEVFHNLGEEIADLPDVSGFDFVAVLGDQDTPSIGAAVDSMTS